MLLSPIFIGLSNLIGTITQLFKNFLVFSLSPIFYNCGILFGIFFLYPHLGIYGLGFGVIIGALLHVSVQIPTVVKHGFFPKFKFKINWQEILRVIKISAPRTFTLSCNSLAFMALIAMASTLKTGSISLFTFAFNLQSVPVGIIGISYSVAAFPVLVRSFSSKDIDNFITHIMGAARQIIFWSLPVISLMIVLRAQIVRVVLGSNAFSWSDTRLTAASAALFIISLASQGLVLLFVRGYYAAGNTKKPLIINVFSSFMMVVFAYFAIYLFRHNPSCLSFIESLMRVFSIFFVYA
jgi:putative peptidoglycan lipid II flippase